MTGVAADVAKASAVAKKTDVRLAPVPAYDTFWETPIKTNPWDVPLEDKLAMLVQTTNTMQKVKGVLLRDRARELQLRVEVSRHVRGVVHRAGLLLHDVRHAARRREHQGQVKTRSYQPGSMTRGYEFVTESDLPAQAERVADRSGGVRDGEAGRRRSQGSGAAALAPRAHHPRDHRPPHRARSHRRLRGQLRGHELREGGRPRQAEIRIEVAEHRRRPHPPGRDVDRRLRRRRRQGAEVADHQGRHPRRAADQPRDRALHRREGEPRLHLRQPLAQLSVPAHAEHPAARRARRDRRRSIR